MTQTAQQITTSEPLEQTDKSGRDILIGLMTPFITIVLNVSMFTVAVPTVRSEFGLQADAAAWVVTAYILFYIISLPVYGRLGDAFDKRRLFVIGLGIFLAGTTVALWAPNLLLLMAGRAIQGIGAASANPLSMAIIADLFPDDQKGEKLGTWNSIGPLTGIVGPFLAGFLIDYFGWRALFVVVMILGLVVIPMLRAKVPPVPGAANRGFLRHFDWGGAVLLAAMMASFLLYLSSRPVTGVAPLQDWRLGLLTAALLAGFIFWERRQENPCIKLNLLTDWNFTLASTTVSLRMFVMKGLAFLIPLYLTDVFDKSAASIGTYLAANAVALLITMRIGGQLADRWDRRWPIIIGSIIQTASLAYFALLPETVGLAFIIGGLALHGLGAGLSLAALHRTALDETCDGETATTAGLYSTIRFSGSVLGSILAGVVLQSTMNPDGAAIEAYKTAFWFFAGAGVVETVLGATLKQE